MSDVVSKVCRICQPGCRTVSVTVRIVQKFSAPFPVRKRPETLCRTFVIPNSRSASLFKNGTSGS